MNFNELKIKSEVLNAIDHLGFTTPTKIQEKIIPLIVDGFDVVGQAETGTGKTMAFTVGMLTNLDYSSKHVKTLVLAPTRELAIQISEEIKKLSTFCNLKVLSVYGNSSIEEQIRKLKSGIDIVVGTPGRVLDLIKRKVLILENLQFFILDEADEMLDMGFKEDLESIFNASNQEKQVLLFSATMPKTILSMAKKYMKQTFEEVSVVTNIKTAKNIRQVYYLINDKYRTESMCRILDQVHPKRAIIFCNTKKSVDELYADMSKRKYNVDMIHGDITQSQRITTLDRFKKGAFTYLVATDVAARGIHVEDIELVVNYHLPQDDESYIHRIGRTGRVNKSGLAVSFVSSREEREIGYLEKYINTKIEKENVPTLDDILPARYEDILQDIRSKTSDCGPSVFNDYLNQLGEDELKQICNYLLDRELKRKMGSNFGIDISLPARIKSTGERTEFKSRRDNKSRDRYPASPQKRSGKGSRVFLTVGKMDQINKKELLELLEKTASIPKGTCSNVEILTKFTFLNVEEKYLDQLIKKCNHLKYNNKVIKIEKAKN